jgi:hypothetical protein
MSGVAVAHFYTTLAGVTFFAFNLGGVAECNWAEKLILQQSYARVWIWN